MNKRLNPAAYWKANEEDLVTDLLEALGALRGISDALSPIVLSSVFPVDSKWVKLVEELEKAQALLYRHQVLTGNAAQAEARKG